MSALGRYSVTFHNPISLKLNSLEYTQDNRKFTSIVEDLIGNNIDSVSFDERKNIELNLDATTKLVVSLQSSQFTRSYAFEISDLNNSYPTTKHFSRPPQPSKLERHVSNPRISELSAIKMLRDEINELPEIKKQKPDQFKAMGHFVSRIKYAIGLAFKEKEIFLFVLLQWLVVMLGYYLWVQMLDWIPQETWQRAANDEDTTGANIALTVWSFLVVGLVAYPLGILSACMASVHFLRKQHYESTIGTCMKTVLPHSFALWILHWIDGWYTVNRILDRLPKKNDTESYKEKALKEALYYAWKIAISGMLPSITLGSGLIQGAKNSLIFVKVNFKEIALLRIGYSLFCWVVGILTYILTILFFVFTNVMSDTKDITEGIYGFYMWVGIPAAVGIGVVIVILRPIYLISLCDVYSDHIDNSEAEKITLDRASRGENTFYAFVLIAIVILLIYIFREQLGILDLLTFYN